MSLVDIGATASAAAIAAKLIGSLAVAEDLDEPLKKSHTGMA